MVIDNKITEKGDVLIIETPSPFTGIRKITELDIHGDKTSGMEPAEISTTYRYSYDKILWSDYRPCEKVSDDTFMKDRDVWMEIKIELLNKNAVYVYESAEIDTESYQECNKLRLPQCMIQSLHAGDGSSCNGQSQIVYNCACGSSNTYDPYSIMNKSRQIYNQLSSLVSNMFGFCVDYFKTEASKRSKDFILHEYSLENVVARDNVKILIPDNQLPTREIQFNPLMLDYPVNFEVHIVKAEFQNVFGADAHPEVHDYLYMKDYMNRMYEVDSVQEADDFGYTSSYWRVSLKVYEQRSAVKYSEQSLLDDTQELIFSASDKFKEDVEKEINDIRKDNQLNDLTLYAGGGDWLREYINDNVSYTKNKLYNRSHAMSVYQYDMSSLVDNIAVTYRTKVDYSFDNEHMISFLFNIDKIEQGGEYTFIRIGDIDMKYVESTHEIIFGSLKYTLSKPLASGTWYSLILKIKDGFSGLYLYSFAANSLSSVMTPIDYQTKNIGRNKYSQSGASVSLVGFNGSITNFRLWKNVCEEKENIGILAQNIIKDSSLAIIVDNGKESLPVANKYN